MKFEVHVDKKHFFILLGAILILAGAIYSYAQPEIFGHDWYEIDNRPAGLDNGDDDTNAKTECGNNKFLDGDGQCRTASQIVNDGGGEIGVTTKTYGPYSTQTNINLGVWQYCSLGGISTSRENHGAKVWKSGSNWYAGSTGFSDASVQQFWVNCWKFS